VPNQRRCVVEQAAGLANQPVVAAGMAAAAAVQLVAMCTTSASRFAVSCWMACSVAW
jgi:hypothetical protein